MSDLERGQLENEEGLQAEPAPAMEEAAVEATRPEEAQENVEEAPTVSDASPEEAGSALDVQGEEVEAEAEQVVEFDDEQRADAEADEPLDEGATEEGPEIDEPGPEAMTEEAVNVVPIEVDVDQGPPAPQASEEDLVDSSEALEAAMDAGQMLPSSSAVEEMIADAEAVELDLEAADEDEVEAPPDDDRLWYVIHCYSGQENKVRHNLEQRIDSMGMKDRIFDVVVPTEEEIEVKDGKRRTVERRVFPGYILVQMILTEESWYVVRNTPGVTGFVGMGNEPTPLRPEEVSQIIKRMEAEAPRIKVTYKIGQKVRIIDGPFNDFIGTVDDIDMERAKVRVMVSFFGRETPVELDFLQVEKA